MTLGFCDSLVLGAALIVTSASGLAAEEHDPVTVSHGYSYFGDLKYPADFAHLDYVNPAAPKGGEISNGLLEPLTASTPMPARAIRPRYLRSRLNQS